MRAPWERDHLGRPSVRAGRPRSQERSHARRVQVNETAIRSRKQTEIEIETALPPPFALSLSQISISYWHFGLQAAIFWAASCSQPALVAYVLLVSVHFRTS